MGVCIALSLFLVLNRGKLCGVVFVGLMNGTVEISNERDKAEMYYILSPLSLLCNVLLYCSFFVFEREEAMMDEKKQEEDREIKKRIRLLSQSSFTLEQETESARMGSTFGIVLSLFGFFLFLFLDYFFLFAEEMDKKTKLNVYLIGVISTITSVPVYHHFNRRKVDDATTETRSRTDSELNVKDFSLLSLIAFNFWIFSSLLSVLTATKLLRESLSGFDSVFQLTESAFYAVVANLVYFFNYQVRKTIGEGAKAN